MIVFLILIGIIIVAAIYRQKRKKRLLHIAKAKAMAERKIIKIECAKYLRAHGVFLNLRERTITFKDPIKIPTVRSMYRFLGELFEMPYMMAYASPAYCTFDDQIIIANKWTIIRNGQKYCTDDRLSIRGL